MMKRYIFYFVAFLLCTCLFGCDTADRPGYLDATEYGVLTDNDGLCNSQNLQKMIDDLSASGGTIYIPAGEYEFAENGTQTIGSHCIKMRSNVSIIGDGSNTILKPVGESLYGLDMFYFNEYLDTNQPIYLENCRFENFVIDGEDTSCETYTSAGKGFMFNLFRNCHWKNVTVKNTDATGFGVDCPFDSTITSCIAIGCGKGATESCSGASGFGIGYGYADEEYLQIRDCVALDNKKFGFFFEHQGRFDPDRYQMDNQGSFLVIGCSAERNLYNFGGIYAENVTYQQCSSTEPRGESVYFEDCNNCVFDD